MQPIPYWLSKTPEVSSADIAEVPFNVFASDKRHARQVRLVVRRARPTPSSQLALFTAWDYNAFVTDRTLPLAEAEADHRRHAVIEQRIAELKSAGLVQSPVSTEPAADPSPVHFTRSATPMCTSSSRPTSVREDGDTGG